MKKKTTVGEYLITRLQDAGVGHVFGIPGDYVLAFYDQMVASPLKIVGTSHEAGAAFAADAYARVRGVGAICVTYAVGGLNTINAVAGAYAEKSPLIVISGAPGLGERKKTPYLHHRIREFDTQLKIFAQVTAAAVAIENPDDAPEQIDRTILAALHQKRPVYIELPRDVVTLPCDAPGPLDVAVPGSDPDVLNEALDEASEMLLAAERPAVLAGVEIHRFALQERLLQLIGRSGYPVAATLLGKSVISELHPQYLGVYEGAMGRAEVTRRIEDADCLLVLGAFMTDINLGVYTANLDISRMINATSERIQIRHHSYEGVVLGDFIRGLTQRIGGMPQPTEPVVRANVEKHVCEPERPVTVRRFFRRMNDFLDDDMIVISDVGDSLFGAVDLTIHRRTEFLSPAYYTSMGFGVPAALGAQTGMPSLRPVVFVGDGAFQMTGHEIATIARNKLNPIIFVLNNQGYTTERFINEGPYNDIQDQAYHKWTELLGTGLGLEARTEGELETVLDQARANTGSFTLVNLHLDKLDHSDALERLGQRLRAQSGLEREGENAAEGEKRSA